MPTPGFIPVGEEYHATIRRGRLEEVIEGESGNLRFPSAAAAVRHAQIAIARQSKSKVLVISEEERVRRQWKLDRAEEHRREREAFDMRNVRVVKLRRRGPR